MVRGWERGILKLIVKSLKGGGMVKIKITEWPGPDEDYSYPLPDVSHISKKKH